jgi:hypothetical protein
MWYRSHGANQASAGEWPRAGLVGGEGIEPPTLSV